MLTGAKGQVGSEIRDLFDSENFDLLALGKEDLDITSINELEKRVLNYKPDVIVNAAAFTNVDLAEEEVEESYKINCDAVKNIARTCKKYEILLIHISTDYVFDGSNTSCYVETDETFPINNYGKSKLAGEAAISSILNNHIILRTSWVFGKEGNNFVKKIVELLSSKNTINVVNDQYGCPTSAKSIAQVILEFCKEFKRNKYLDYGIYHYSNSPETSWFLFAEEIMRLSLKRGLISEKIEILPVPSTSFKTLSRRPINSTMSTKKIEEVMAIKSSKWKAELEHMLNNI